MGGGWGGEPGGCKMERGLLGGVERVVVGCRGLCGGVGGSLHARGRSPCPNFCAGQMDGVAPVEVVLVCCGKKQMKAGARVFRQPRETPGREGGGGENL